QLDADLGIDSIKRVEILSTIQERLPDAPVIKPDHLGALRTLGDIVDFLAGPDSTPDSVRGTANAETQAVGTTREGAVPAATADSIAPSNPLLRLVPRAVPLARSSERMPARLPEGAVIWLADDGSELPRALVGVLKAHGAAPRVIGKREWSSVEIP